MSCLAWDVLGQSWAMSRGDQQRHHQDPNRDPHQDPNRQAEQKTQHGPRSLLARVGHARDKRVWLAGAAGTLRTRTGPACAKSARPPGLPLPIRACTAALPMPMGQAGVKWAPVPRGAQRHAPGRWKGLAGAAGLSRACSPGELMAADCPHRLPLPYVTPYCGRREVVPMGDVGESLGALPKIRQ